MNFTYEVTKPPDKKFGGLTKDGSWNGLVNELQNKRADIGIVLYLLSKHKKQKLD